MGMGLTLVPFKIAGRDLDVYPHIPMVLFGHRYWPSPRSGIILSFPRLCLWSGERGKQEEPGNNGPLSCQRMDVAEITAKVGIVGKTLVSLKIWCPTFWWCKKNGQALQVDPPFSGTKAKWKRETFQPVDPSLNFMQHQPFPEWFAYFNKTTLFEGDRKTGLVLCPPSCSPPACPTTLHRCSQWTTHQWPAGHRSMIEASYG